MKLQRVHRNCVPCSLANINNPQLKCTCTVPLLEQIAPARAPGMFKVPTCYPKFPSVYFNCHTLDHQDVLPPAVVPFSRHFVHLHLRKTFSYL
jgi:hypothetical protein